MGDDWFKKVEEEYLNYINNLRGEFEEAKASFEEAKASLEEAEATLERFRAKYPPGYKGPAPWY